MNTVSRRDYSRYPYRMVEWMHENLVFHLNYATIFFFSRSHFGRGLFLNGTRDEVRYFLVVSLSIEHRFVQCVFCQDYF